MQFDAIDEVKPGYYHACVVEPSLQLIIFLLLSHQTGEKNMVILMLLFWDSTYNLCNTSKLNYKCWRAVQISLHQGLGSSSLPTSVFTLWFSLGCRIFSEKCGSFDTSSFIFVLLMRLIVGLFLGTTMRRCYRSKYFW